MKNKLQIILITYNRKKKLQSTVDQLLKSPIKDFDIVVLDNASTDGTSELLDEYATKHKNIKHIRHQVNIGGNANICRAFEIGAASGKDYVWVLCDDDDYDWSKWQKIQDAIASNKYDLIFTNCCLNVNSADRNYGYLAFIAAFVPGVIYKTCHITPDIIQNMYATICTWYSQSVLSLDIMCNKKGAFFIPDENLVIRGNIVNEKDNVESLVRDIGLLHPDMQRMFWHVGFIRVAQIVKDKKIRQEVINGAKFTENFGMSFKDYVKYIIDFNKEYKDGNIKNLFDVYSNLEGQQKSIFLKCYFHNWFRMFIKKVFSISRDRKNGRKYFYLFGKKIYM